ncbi:hypothetical protein [Glycomyces buryatensis]|uniref:Uncharacterized protein n=1 Tax=Glycomyces buryatensis TaxID=2570927 RepID=A0A4S8Q852_9ACTN|nr:hypothetical protein [Glycomyces buryatensis]THV40557.1 hypothetical protein FAB82_14925 [Glycomyces buryatensis]
MDRRKLRYRLEWFAQQAKVVAKSVLQGNNSYAAEERPRLDQARADVLEILPARDHKAAIANLDAIVEFAGIIEQYRWDAWNARRNADKMRYKAEADLQETEIERLIVEVSGHIGHQ